MAKLIFTSRYIRDAPPEHLQNYVRYISTREGVEKADESKKNLPATSAQKDLIRQLLKDMPESKDMLEYEDYRQRSTIGNASEFITQALERNLDMAAMKENYVDYLANRPRVERIGEHGLFTDAGKPVILSEVQKEVSGHKGPVWTHVVSLRLEDAARLGYDSAREWMSLLSSKRAMLSRHMKIDSADLRWYAAFHNEGHHPHVHLMVYSAKDNDGFLTKAGIEAMRSELAHDIFRQDFAQIYEGQNLARSSLKEKAAERMCLLADGMLQGVCESPIIGEKLQQLSGRLKNTEGKKVYGYLKADVKRLVDQIVDEMAKDPAVSEAYRAWGEWQDQIRLAYSSKAPPLPPLSSQKQLKSIKNMVIAEALKLGGHHFLSETSGQERKRAEVRLDELEGERISDGSEEIEETEIETKAEAKIEAETEPDPADAESMLEAEELLSEPERDVPGPFEGKEKTSAKAEWSRQYKLARSYLYGSKKVPQDFQEAMRLFCQEAEQGNALAMYDLGRMWADGLGVEADPDAAREWYRKALNALLSAEKELPERKKTYLQYRIGKMYLVGLGTDQDYETAALWLERAAEKSHKYAQYTLAGLYAKGQGVERDLKRAFSLYHASAIQGNPYASYELAKMFRDGTGTKKSAEQAEEHFQDAFSGFLVLEEQSHDDKLQYVYFTEEQKERANTVDLKDFLERQGERLLRSGPEWRMSSDHSITIRGNRWYDHGSAGKGGAAIDFVIYYYGKTFPDAVSMLLGGEQGQTYRQSRKQEEVPRKPFALPAANGDMRRVFAYLMWKDVDFNEKCLRINRSLSCQYEYGKKMLRLLSPKTHNSYRKIPFFGEAEEMLLQQKAKTDCLKKALGNRFRATGEYADLVFVTTMGSPVLRYHAEKEIKKVVKEINEQEAFESVQEQREPHYFEDMYPHAIRHTFCSRCFEAGMQPKVVQSIMGHQHYSTTIDIYTHVSESRYQEEIGKFGRAVEPEETESKEPEKEQSFWLGQTFG